MDHETLKHIIKLKYQQQHKYRKSQVTEQFRKSPKNRHELEPRINIVFVISKGKQNSTDDSGVNG